MSYIPKRFTSFCRKRQFDTKFSISDLRLDRERIDDSRQFMIHQVTSQQDVLNSNSFVFPREKETELMNVYKRFISEVKKIFPNTILTLEEACYVVFCVFTNRKNISEANNLLGAVNQDKWKSLRPYIDMLSAYYKEPVSSRKQIITVMDTPFENTLYMKMTRHDLSVKRKDPEETEKRDTGTPINSDITYDRDWLAALSAEYLVRSGLDEVYRPIDISNQILTLLKKKNNEDLPIALYELLGDYGAETIPLIVEHKNEILLPPPSFDSKRTGNSGMVIEREEDLDDSKLRKKLLRSGKKGNRLEALGFSKNAINESERQGLHLPVDLNSTQWADEYKPYLPGVKLSDSVEYDRITTNIGTTKYLKGYKEVSIPPNTEQKSLDIDRVSVDELEEWAQPMFGNITHFNRLQSWVFDAAYNHDYSLLIAAPTGAGKTNVALLSICHELSRHLEDGVIDRENLKIIYIAPMKALAQEVVEKFTKPLKTVGLEVKELTGDMQLTRQEAEETQVIVTTPEKWDVITRKAVDYPLVQKVGLIILDEVHLLASDRGNVLESIIARTHRQMITQQTQIRIIGLSATLPNYMDVAEFLHVPKEGVFYCDDSFRPVPLAYKFVGITERNRLKAQEMLLTLTYENVINELKSKNQIMVFVNSRKSTLVSALKMIELAGINGTQSLFVNDNIEELMKVEDEVRKLNNPDLSKLFFNGIGIHHAGMKRPERKVMESLFARGYLRVLFCTATLAWGVNLPAHTVIIEGTELYDAERGGFVDEDILDIIQIFGRAGRPQFDTSGYGIMISGDDKIDKYIKLLAMKTPIESNFMKRLNDALNAEIIAGTITNMSEAVSWIRMTYMYIRMMKNPMVYGIKYEEKQNDPSLWDTCERYIRDAAHQLDECHMIRYDDDTSVMFPTDLGRVASHYYLSYDTIQTFNELLKPDMTLETALECIASASEFEQLKIRDEELEFLDSLNSAVPLHVKGVEDARGKAMLLIEAYIINININHVTLHSDLLYISQNAGRIARALFEIVLQKGWPQPAALFLNLCKSIDKRLWINSSPLLQIQTMHKDYIKRIEKLHLSLEELQEDGFDQLAIMFNKDIAKTIKNAINILPYMDIQGILQPITSTIIRISVTLTAKFKWNNRYNGASEPFYVWLEDPRNNRILHQEYFTLTAKKAHEPATLEFAIPLFPPVPHFYTLKVVSDKWMGVEMETQFYLDQLVMTKDTLSTTRLLDLTPLPVTALHNKKFESIYKFSHFNPVQTQVFFEAYNTDNSVLLCAPTSSGKTVIAELAIMRMLYAHKGDKAIYIGPLKSLVRERLDDWKRKFEQQMGHSVVELTGDSAPELGQVKESEIIVTTPEKWDGVSRQWQQRDYVKKVSVIIIDEIHLLGAERGPIIEVIVSRMKHMAKITGKEIRIIGLSTALANANDLGNWLGIESCSLYNFSHSVRPVQLQIHISGYPGKYYCPRMNTMNKPTYTAIKEYSHGKPVIVFVSSRRQTRLTSMALINFAAADNPFQFLNMDASDMDIICKEIKDDSLRQCLQFGIGLHHAGLNSSDRLIVERLFAQEKILVLCSTSTLAWGVNLPAYMVVIKGTEFFDKKTCRYIDYPITDVLQMLGRAGRPQFDKEGVGCVLVHDVKKNYYKKFLYEPFPVESSLHKQLTDHINAEITAGTLISYDNIIDYISWTFLFRRLISNPSYYGVEPGENNRDYSNILKYLNLLIDTTLDELEDSKCIERDEKDKTILKPLPLGKICSFYYLHYKSMKIFSDGLPGVHDLETMTELISEASEYDEVPVRHCEDEINESFSKYMYWSIPNNADFESAHLKTYLLLQAYMMRLDLPIVDYYNDQASVLDQSIRIINALIEICIVLHCSQQIDLLFELSPLLIQGLLPSGNELLQIKDIDMKLSNKIQGQNIKTIKELLNMNDNDILAMLNRVGCAGEKSKNLLKNIRSIPNLSYSYNLCTSTKEIIPSSSTSPYILLTNTCYQLQLQLQYEREVPFKVYAPLFKKPKNYGWNILIKDSNDTIISFKRTALRLKQTLMIPIDSLPSTDISSLTITIASDSIKGLVYTFKIPLLLQDSMDNPLSDTNDNKNTISGEPSVLNTQLDNNNTIDIDPIEDY
ncbi:hypothetical protein WA158_007151 [Blastocystis sp. Blastoise]